MARAQTDAEGNVLEGEYQSGVVIETGFRRRRWYHRRDVRFVSLIAAFVIAFQAYGYITGPSRIGGDVQARIDQGAETIDILVTANFKAEAFHMEIYQELGALAGEEGDAVIVRRVSPDEIRFLSRKYWIKSIDLAK